MEDRVSYFSTQFCNDIEQSIKIKCYGLYSSLRSDLQLYDNKEKLEYIQSKKNDLRKNLEGSDYKQFFSVKSIKTGLTQCLEAYFFCQIISRTSVLEFNDSIEPGQFKINYKERKLILNPIESTCCFETEFNFSRLYEFRPLVQYIVWGKMFIKINKIDAKIRKKVISERGETLTETTSSEVENKENIRSEISDAPEMLLNNSYQIAEDKQPVEQNNPISLLDINKYGNFISEQISTKENTNTTTEKQSDISIDNTPHQLNGLEIDVPKELTLLTQNQIALILIYEDIKSINWQDIATKYGFTAKGSAVKISQHYNKLQLTQDRQGEPANPTKTKIRHNRAKIEGILPYLTSDNARKRAIEDINALEKIYTEFLDK